MHPVTLTRILLTLVCLTVGNCCLSWLALISIPHDPHTDQRLVYETLATHIVALQNENVDLRREIHALKVHTLEGVLDDDVGPIELEEPWDPITVEVAPFSAATPPMSWADLHTPHPLLGHPNFRPVQRGVHPQLVGPQTLRFTVEPQ